MLAFVQGFSYITPNTAFISHPHLFLKIKFGNKILLQPGICSFIPNLLQLFSKDFEMPLGGGGNGKDGYQRLTYEVDLSSIFRVCGSLTWCSWVVSCSGRASEDLLDREDDYEMSFGFGNKSSQ